MTTISTAQQNQLKNVPQGASSIEFKFIVWYQGRLNPNNVYRQCVDYKVSTITEAEAMMCREFPTLIVYQLVKGF
jgi:hypothetical protein